MNARAIWSFVLAATVLIWTIPTPTRAGEPIRLLGVELPGSSSPERPPSDSAPQEPQESKDSIPVPPPPVDPPSQEKDTPPLGALHRLRTRHHVPPDMAVQLKLMTTIIAKTERLRLGRRGRTRSMFVALTCVAVVVLLSSHELSAPSPAELDRERPAAARIAVARYTAAQLRIRHRQTTITITRLERFSTSDTDDNHRQRLVAAKRYRARLRHTMKVMARLSRGGAPSTAHQALSLVAAPHRTQG